MTENLNADEVIIIDSHEDIFKKYQIHFWSKDRISDILPAIECPSFKSKIKNFKTSEMKEIWNFIYDQKHTKSIEIENTDEELSINLVYGNTVKIAPRTICDFQLTNFFDKLKVRYKLWEIEDCICKPKKIRVWVEDFRSLKYAIEKLERFSNIKDIKLGVDIDSELYDRYFSNYDTIVFNHSSRRMSDKEAKFIFTGDTLAAVNDGNYYNFRLDQRTKESKNSYIKGKI